MDPEDHIAWASQHARDTFPEYFSPGKSFESWLQDCTVPEQESFQGSDLETIPPEGELRRVSTPDSGEPVYRYLTVPLDTAGPGYTLRYLTKISEEKKL